MKETTNGNGHAHGQKDAKAPASQAEQPWEEVIEQVAAGAEDLLSDLQTTVEKTVRQYPVQSMAVCLGVGCLLGALWASRR